MDRTDFFKTLYQYCEGKIEIRPLPGKPGFFETDDHDGFDSHCKQFAQSNLFFGIATRDGRGGGKQNIVNIPAV